MEMIKRESAHGLLGKIIYIYHYSERGKQYWDGKTEVESLTQSWGVRAVRECFPEEMMPL